MEVVNMMSVWNAYAEYEDGTIIDVDIPHNTDTYEDECDYQQYLEEWLMYQHQDIIFYSVSITDEI